MKIKTMSLIVAAVILPALQGCTTFMAHGKQANAHLEIPAENPMLDHYIAWIPREQAQTAAVAEAMAHISMVNAREQTADQLCSGQWIVQGRVANNIGPLPVMAPEATGGYPAWYYRISHLPGIQGCNNADTELLYTAMRENLPDWINIKTATTTTLSRLD